MSASDLYANAQRDRQGGKLDLAVQEFGDYVRWYDVVANNIAKLSKSEQDRIMGGTAVEAYDLSA